MPSLDTTRLNEGNVSLESDASDVASMLGYHLVNQVLDEACTIVTASKRIGWPAKCIRMIYADLQEGKDTDISNLTSLLHADIQGVNEKHECKKIGATSTPHKGETAKKPDDSLIGQGDEKIEMNDTKLSNSTLDFINYLFDMGEAENEANTCDDVKIGRAMAGDSDMTTGVICDIMEKMFLDVMEIACKKEEPVFFDESECVTVFDEIREYKKSSQYYPFFNVDGLDCLSDNVIVSGVEKTMQYLNESESDTEYEKITPDEKSGQPQYSMIMPQGVYDIQQPENDAAMPEKFDRHDDIDGPLFTFDPEPRDSILPEGSYKIVQNNEEENAELEKVDVSRYEDTYLTLNRDYEQGSEDGEPILEDPKSLAMQDVELVETASQEDNSSIEEGRKALAATSAVSGASGSRRSRTSLVSRCKSQGARLLACLRGWWRRKTPGKRKEARMTGSIKGVCPLSPDGRRRAASLLDNHVLYSPSQRRSVAWKFNTVNETVVNSDRWKEYTFDVKADVCGEYC